MNRREGQAVFEGGGFELFGEPRRIERRVGGSHPQTAPVEGQLGGIDDIGEFGPVNLVERGH